MFSAQASQVAGAGTIYVEDVFASYTRTGTGSSQTVTTGVNLSAKGGLVISKGRSGATDWAWYDTARGATYDLASNLTSAQTTQAQGLTAFGATGHTWGTLAKVNTNGATYVDYVLAKAPKFFDVVTYTGNGTNPRTISHALGTTPGMIVIKRTDSTGSWWTYHNGLTVNQYLLLESTAAVATSVGVWGSGPTATTFTVNAGALNGAGATYVAYLFATLAGISKVGTYTGNGTSQTINCGFAAGARFVLIKRTDSAGDWFVWDSTRGIIAANDPHLSLNTTAAEVTTDDSVDPDSSGFIVNQLAGIDINVNGASYIYLAFA